MDLSAKTQKQIRANIGCATLWDKTCVKVHYVVRSQVIDHINRSNNQELTDQIHALKNMIAVQLGRELG